MADERLYFNDMDRMTDNMVPAPRHRVAMDRNTPLVLDGTWQAVPYVSGGSAYDVNTFPSLRYDSATKLMFINPSAPSDRNYTISTDFLIGVNDTSTGVKLSLRFVVPRPSQQGGAIYFPLPDTAQRIDLPDQLVSPDGAVHFDFIVYANQVIRTYGVQIQVKATTFRLSGSGLLGGLVAPVITALTGSARPTLKDATLLIYGS